MFSRRLDRMCMPRGAWQRTVLPLHSAIPEATRTSTLAAFARPDRSVLQPMVLVSTDRASRGVDFGARASSSRLLLLAPLFSSRS